LSNSHIAAEFDNAGLTRVTDQATRQSFVLSGDSASITVNGEKLAVPGLRLLDTELRKNSVTFTYTAGDRQLKVIYELRPGWHFVSKQLVLTLPPNSTCRVDHIEMLRANVKTPVARELKASNSSGAVFLRIGENQSAETIRRVPRPSKPVPQVGTHRRSDIHGLHTRS
jgi:hypothetical protein